MVPYEEEDNFIGQGAELPTEVKKRLWKLRRAYKAMILAIDEQVGRIFETLEDEGLLENTIVLFTADHGELMGEHGRMQKTNWHKGSTIVPTAIRHPDHLDRRRVDAPVELTDITATILDAAGLDPQEALSKPWPAFHDRVPCRSLLPVVRGEADRVRDFAFSEGRNGWQMIQTDRWRYIRRPAADPHSRDELLFNLDHDPRELHNLAQEDKYADVLETMRMHVEYVMMHTPPAQLQWAPYEAMEGEIL
jgi:choline-sulfatase